MALVIVYEFCFSTPRIAMHRCVPSHDHRHAERLDLFGDGVRDLVGHPFLQLQPARENVDQARDLAEPDHLPLGM